MLLNTGTNNLGWETTFVSANEIGETIEIVYMETSNIMLAIHPPRPPDRRIFKIIYSCVNGHWNKSDKIYGEIILAQQEHYKF